MIDINPEEISSEYDLILSLIDLETIPEKCLFQLLPHGNKETGKEGLEYLAKDQFSIDPYILIAQRYIEEHFKPGKAYLICAKGYKLGIKKLDSLIIDLYEISKLSSRINLNHEVNIEEYMYLLSLNSHDRFLRLKDFENPISEINNYYEEILNYYSDDNYRRYLLNLKVFIAHQDCILDFILQILLQTD